MATRINADEIRSSNLSEKVHGSEYFSHLRNRLRWQLLFAYLGPLILFSLVFFYQYYETLRREIETHLKSVAENKRNTVSLYLQERIVNVNNSFRFEGDPGGLTSDDLDRLLEEIRRDSSAFVDLGLFSPEGRLIAYAGPYATLLGRDYSGEEWFQLLRRQNGNHYISDVYLGFRKKPHFVVAVKKKIGDRMWVLRASLDPEKFSEFVSRSILLKNGEALIVNLRGELQTTAGDGGRTRAVSYVPKEEMETSVEESEERNGVRYLSACARLTEADWAVLVRMPARIAYAPMNRARIMLVGILVPTLALLCLFIIRQTRRIVGRLEKADRAKEEMRKQLFNAAKLASIGEMAAGVAHEINNPLAIILEEAQLLKDYLDPKYEQSISRKDLGDSVDAIIEAVRRGKTITGKLLHFSRKREAETKPVEVSKIVERALEIKARELEVSGMELIREIDGNMPRVAIDTHQMEQVLLNLLNNAMDAIRDRGGGGRITVIARKKSDDHIDVEIADNGCGMSPEQMEKIFMPFYTTKKMGKGTGLGLSISYAIIKAAGGTIEVVSEAGKGTTFSVVLPIAKETEGR